MIYAVSFTQNGKSSLEALMEQCPELAFTMREQEALQDFVARAFAEKEALLFVGATGIAVRSIAPFVSNKLEDSPVLVMDEHGKCIIPLLSGHVGGANELAIRLADAIGAECILTTATDLNECFAADLFAKERHLTIENKDGIKRVSAKALEGKPITICIKDYPPRESVDLLLADPMTNAERMQAEENAQEKATLYLSYKPYVVGIGCKKGKSYEDIMALLEIALQEASKEEGYEIRMQDLYAIATIELKAEEEGLQMLSKKHRLPLLAFSAELLQKLEGEFSSSDFVAQTVGVDNVCERSALLGAGPASRLILKKMAKDGVTVAIAKRS